MKSKPCTCVKKVNEALSESGAVLENAIQIDFSTGKATAGGPFVSVKWQENLRKKRKLPLITCTYCPFCGKKK